MSLLSLAQDLAVGSNVHSSVAHPGTARQWHHVLYSPHTKQTPPESIPMLGDGMSTSGELGQLLAHSAVLLIYS